MQLRVARLCLDCEELYVGDSCPVCASERYAFLSKWLPSEERRRWRRPAPAPVTGVQGYFHKVRRVLASLFVDVEPQKQPGGPRTRASDHIPPMDFKGPAKDLPPKHAVDHPQPQPAKSNAR